IIFLHSLLAFFSYLADPPLLHSFPTRRSSDLPARVRAVLRPLAGVDRMGLSVEAEVLAVGVADHVRVQQRAVERGVEQPLLAVRDRKSTRLNSSHDQISYAVFCLKKKKQIRSS